MEELREILRKATKLPKEEIKIEQPLQNFGDYSFACFEVAKKQKKSAEQVAAELKQKLKLPKFIAKVEAKKGYLNFWIDKPAFCEYVINEILTKQNYGSAKVKAKALIEHTSLNPNSPPHVGRIRNALIGDALARLLRFHGYNTEVHFYVNDFSKQIALMLLSYKGDESFDELLDLYVKQCKALKQKEVEKKVFEILELIEAKDKGTMKRMNELVNTCVEGQKAVLKQLGINYDCFDHESMYVGMTNKILKRLEKTGRLKKDVESRYVLDLSGLQDFEKEMKSPVLVLTRSDGVGLYPLRDLLYTIDKLKAAPVNIIVLGEDQKLYFKQISAALGLLGFVPPRVVHYSYVLLKTSRGVKKMSTRKKQLVLISDFIREAVEKAKQEIKKRAREKVVEFDRVAQAVGIGAIRYGILKIEEDKPIIFDWKEALSFEGNSGPYLQYSYVRASAILKKIKEKMKLSFDNIDEREYQLVKLLKEWQKVASDALTKLKPSLIAHYGYRLAKCFNDFYESCPVIKAPPELRGRRVALVQATQRVLGLVLNLLGMPLLEQM